MVPHTGHFLRWRGPRRSRSTPERDSLYFAYFEPYSWERHLDLLGRIDGAPLARVERLGSTLEGRDLDLVTVGTPGADRRSVWVIARQHPGETMAEWFVEGMLERLLDAADPVARRILERAVVYVVPNMNPDGAVAGNLRTNAAGANLNREWLNPSLERSPEVCLVRQRMHETGVDLFLDIHGDEALPYVFVDGGSMVPGFHPRPSAARTAFHRLPARRQRRLPDRSWLRPGPFHRRTADAGLEVRRPHLRLPVAHPGDAVQGQRRSAGPRVRLERGAQRPAGGGDASPSWRICSRRTKVARP